MRKPKKSEEGKLKMVRDATFNVGNTFLNEMDHQPRLKANGKYKYVINNFGRFSVDSEDCKLDRNTKLHVLKTAQSVVCLISYSGDEQLFICCGIIMECEASICTTLTSATLLRSPDGSPKLAANIKIDVYVGGGKSVEGRVVGVDFHYNVAILEFYHDPPVSIPEVMCVDNVLEVGVRASLYSNVPVNTSNRYKLSHGDKVLALARYFQEPYDIMIAIGEVSFDYCQLDCKELLKASCKIKKNGIGGPLINLYGEVIGINFYHASYTPFLPMNIIIKCFKDLKENGHVSPPSLGVLANDLHTNSLYYLENVSNKFPHVVRGATIDQVLPNSPAHIAGLCRDDVIINCGGASVGSCLELTEILWGNEGKSVELVVARPSTGEQLTTFVDAVDYNLRVNRWPVPEQRVVRDHPLFHIRM